ncbi:MAG: cytochrome c biosis protein CcmG, thiol:disulfide interchange protein DsbE [Actinomycetota bacterium]|jgi:cytochrome c biogenesis protein CcmG/thiol:disulfide interchange protein DsbE|nr:cytochrome c biosis protein CcmG, thiol:disulfide interchange protein DsbE [Actinomycetota bacterium]
MTEPEEIPRTGDTQSRQARLSVTSSEEEEPRGPHGPPVAVAGLRRTRRALWIAVAVAVPVALLVVVLAVQPPAGTRQVKSPLVGKPAPAATGATIDGAQASLAELRGKWVVVNFFATWCVPCRLEHPDLVRFADQHGTLGDAAVLGVVFGDNTQAVKEFRDKEGGGWPMLTDPSGRIGIDFGVAGVPESFLVDPDGVVVAKIVGGIRAPDLDRLLADARAAG